MTITIPPELAKRFEELARLRGTTPEAEAVEAMMVTASTLSQLAKPKLSYEEILAKYQAIAKPSGVSLPDSAFTSDELYD
jgi:hypothetical protein